MNKPLPQDYELSQTDLERGKKIEERITIIIFCVTAIILLIKYLSSSEFTLNPIVLIFGTGIGFAICIAAILFIGLPTMFILKLLWPFYRTYKKYEDACEAYKTWWVRTQSNFWQSLSGLQFEHELALLYRRLGYRAEVTSASNDKGVDIWLTTNRGKEIVQCKAHKRPIGPGPIRELYGTLQHFGVTNAILASTSGFTKGASEAAKNKPISLLSLSDILSMQERCQNQP